MARPRAVETLIERLGDLPGIGPKTSERLAYFLLRSEERVAEGLASAIVDARRSTKVCGRCFNLDDRDPCRICEDENRDRELLLVVEDPRDVAAFEESGYRGIYHVLQGRVSSLEGIGIGDLTVKALVARMTATPRPKEVVLATNPDLEGEGTAQLLVERLGGGGATITRIARGIPAGSNITQVSKSILADAIEGRRRLS